MASVDASAKPVATPATRYSRPAANTAGGRASTRRQVRNAPAIITSTTGQTR